MDRRGFLVSGSAAGLAGTLGLGGALAGRLVGPEAAALRGGRAWAKAADAVRLHSNENPLGLSPGAREAVAEALDVANRYPDVLADRLVEALAKRHGVAAEQVVLGNGSTEILQMTVQAAASPGRPLVLAEPTFEHVRGYQEPYSYEPLSVPLTRDHAHDVPAMRDAATRAGRPAVVYVCNPNNPTGTLTPSRDVEAWIREAPERVLFLVDEAYFEYASDPGYRTAIPLTRERSNLVVARTFSKIFGMAGLRLGYAVAHPGTADRLRTFVANNNANHLALAAALASLEDDGLVPRGLAVDRKAKAVAHECLDELGLERLPSHANFLMHRIGSGPATLDLDSYIGRMREAGLRVGRPFPPMTGWNRLSMGLPEEMARWAETLRDFRRKGWV